MTGLQEWREGLRSSLHPLLFASVYQIAAWLSDLLGLNIGVRAKLLMVAPKILQATFAAAMDFFTYKLAARTYGVGSAASYCALFMTGVSPWQAFCSVRTLSNSIETTLTVFALYLWPWTWFTASSRSKKADNEASGATKVHQPPTHLCGSLAAAALACILRPTNIIVWATVSLTLLTRNGSFGKALGLAQAALLSGGAILAIAMGADKAFYGDWILPPLRFLQFNLVQSLAVFYGKNRPDYYFTEGLPLLLTTTVPFAVLGMWSALRPQSDQRQNSDAPEQIIRFTLAAAVVVSVLTLSLISHKEVRFIYPLLPMLHVLAAAPMAKFFNPIPLPKKNYKRALLLLFVCINGFIAWYTVFVHQRGVIDVMDYFRRKHEATATTTTVGFLMPCHSTPWRSHLIHPGIHAWALSCEPPLNLTTAERESYMDEADVFYEDPANWMDNNMRHDASKRYDWPEYLVSFAQLEDQLSAIFARAVDRGDLDLRYERDWHTFNTHWHDDRRRQGDIIVWRRDTSTVRDDL